MSIIPITFLITIQSPHNMPPQSPFREQQCNGAAVNSVCVFGFRYTHFRFHSLLSMPAAPVALWWYKVLCFLEGKERKKGEGNYNTNGSNCVLSPAPPPPSSPSLACESLSGWVSSLILSERARCAGASVFVPEKEEEEKEEEEPRRRQQPPQEGREERRGTARQAAM